MPNGPVGRHCCPFPVAISRTTAEGIRPRIRGQFIAWNDCLLPDFTGTHNLTPEGWRAELASIHSSHRRGSNPRPRSSMSGTIPLGHHEDLSILDSCLLRPIIRNSVSEELGVRRLTEQSTCKQSSLTRNVPHFW